MALPAGVTLVTNIKGDRGPSGTIASVQVVTIPAGQPASVVMSGPEDAKNAIFYIPAGPPGEGAGGDSATAAFVASPVTETRAAVDGAVVAQRTDELDPTGATGVMFAALPLRDVAPVVVAFAGCSHTLGASASLPGFQFADATARMVRDAYPSMGDDVNPLIRNLSDAVAAAPLPAGLHFVNAAVGSTTSANFLTDSTSDSLASLAPALIIMDAGFSNDYANGVTPATAKANLVSRLGYLRAAIGAPVGFVLVHVHDRSTGSPVAPWAEFGQAMREVAREFDDVSFLDVSAPFRIAESTTADPYGLVAPDGTHLNNRGQEVITSLLVPAVFKVMPERVGVPDDHVGWVERITSDSFSGANTTTLAGRTTDAALGGEPAVWGSAGGTSAIHLFGNELIRGTTPSSQAINIPCTDPDVRVGIVAKNMGATPIYLGARMSHNTVHSESNGYVLDISWDVDGSNTGAAYLYRVVSGVRSGLAAPVRFAYGDRVELETVGNLIGVRVNGRLVRQVTDYTTQQSTFVFFGVYSTATFTVDDFTLDRVASEGPSRNFTRSRFASDMFSGGNASTIDGRSTDSGLGGSARSWVTSPGSTQHIQIVSGRLARGTSGTPVATITGAGANSLVGVTLSALPTGSGAVYLFGRRSTQASSTASQYRAAIFADGTARLERTNSSTTGIALSGNVRVRAGDRVELAMLGSTIDLLVNGRVAATVVDSNVTGAGLSGMEIQAAVSAFRLDDFVIDNIS